MPRTTTRLVALGAAAVAVAIAATPAAARSTLVDDDAAILTRAAAAGLHPEGDNLYQATGAIPVFGAYREVASVPASALLGRSASGMATVLRDTLAKAGGHYAVVDDAGAAFRGSQGDTLAAAFALAPLAARADLPFGQLAFTAPTATAAGDEPIDVWVRFTLVPGLTDDPANVEALARFVAPMKNVQWVEVQPFHQLGAFKWKTMGLDYPEDDTPTPTPDLISRVIGQFRDAGCNVR